jgi:hypothetical protein
MNRLGCRARHSEDALRLARAASRVHEVYVGLGALGFPF